MFAASWGRHLALYAKIFFGCPLPPLIQTNTDGGFGYSRRSDSSVLGIGGHAGLIAPDQCPIYSSRLFSCNQTFDRTSQARIALVTGGTRGIRGSQLQVTQGCRL